MRREISLSAMRLSTSAIDRIPATARRYGYDRAALRAGFRPGAGVPLAAAQAPASASSGVFDGALPRAA